MSSKIKTQISKHTILTKPKIVHTASGYNKKNIQQYCILLNAKCKLQKETKYITGQSSMYQNTQRLDYNIHRMEINPVHSNA